MKISARNVLAGTITHVEQGAVNTEVSIKVEGGSEIVSIITRHSAERLNLHVGKKAYAVIKSSDVMIGLDE